MIKTSRHLKSSNFFSVLGLLILCFAVLQAMTWAIDHRSFPGCVIVGHETGNVLVIELDEQLATGTDASCEAAGQLIYSICLEGYRVRVTNWTISEVIGLEQAYWLARGY